MIPVIALLIKMDSRGPVFFFQKRVGKGGSPFTCFKFRTMFMNKEPGNDFTITGIGRFLRQSNLDELPQFFNVLLGNMSIVGPRPHMYRDCRRFSGYIANYDSRNIVKPGITGLAQAKGYHGPVSDPVAIYNRYYWDMIYIKKFNFLLDLRIVFETAWQRIIWMMRYPFLRNNI
jgi:putative colanic acid biosynthesis UDP-glucose lipid carrier transferase